MGYMTEIGILNDRWDEIRKEPAKFVQQIYENSISNGRINSWVIGQTTVAKTHHADEMKVYIAYQNSFTEAWPDRNIEIRLLEYHLKDLDLMISYLKASKKETEKLLEKTKVPTK